MSDIHEHHTLDPVSGALIFRKSPGQLAAEAATSKAEALALLLSAVIDVLPKNAKDKLPAELLEVVYGTSAD